MAGNGSGVQGFQIQAGATFGELLAANNLSDVISAATSNQNLFFNSIIVPTFTTNATTLGSTAYGALVELTNGGVAGTVNLPAAVTGKKLTLLNASTAAAIMLIDPNAAETINGISTMSIGAGDMLTLVGVTGAGWLILANNISPAYCYITTAGVQSIPANVATKVHFDTVGMDINGFFDVSTNYSYTPLLPGVYQISTTVGLDSTGAGGVVTASVFILKNGSLIQAASAGNILVTTTSIFTANILVRLNGSTDAITVAITQDSSTDPSLNITAGCNFSAIRVGTL